MPTPREALLATLGEAGVATLDEAGVGEYIEELLADASSGEADEDVAGAVGRRGWPAAGRCRSGCRRGGGRAVVTGTSLRSSSWAVWGSLGGVLEGGKKSFARDLNRGAV